MNRTEMPRQVECCGENSTCGEGVCTVKCVEKVAQIECEFFDDCDSHLDHDDAGIIARACLKDCCDFPSDNAEQQNLTTSCINHFGRILEEYNRCLTLGQCFCRQFVDYLDGCCGQKSLSPISVYQDDELYGVSAGSTAVFSRNREFIPRYRSKKSVNNNSPVSLINSCDESCEETKNDVISCTGACCDDKDIRGDNDTCDGSCFDNNEEIQRDTGNDTCGDSCCDEEDIHMVGDIDTCGGSCCDDDDLNLSSTAIVKENQTNIIEDHESQDFIEKIVLNVSGMTCSGCSKKVNNVLSKIPGIESINVQFVTGITEFSMDKNKIELPSVITKLSRETGFKFIKLERNLQTLEINCPSSQSLQDLEILLEKYVSNVELSSDSKYRNGSKNNFSITYDPSLIGARDILSKIPNVELAPPNFNTNLKEGFKKLKLLFWKCLIALALAIPVCVLSWSDLDSVSYNAKTIISLILATFVQLISITEFYVGALRELFYSKVLEMDMLVVISITAAYGYSIVIFILRHVGINVIAEEIFETSSLLIALVLIGRFLAAYSKLKAVDSVSLRSLQAEQAIIIEDGSESTIDARLIQLNDKVLVPPHSRIVTDGIIIQGESAVDESMITGESIPIEKNVKSEVVAGTINGSGKLILTVTRLPGQNSITDIATMVENAISEKPKTQELADIIAGYFIPVVITLGLIVFIIWLIIGLKVRNQSIGKAISSAINYGIAVLAISCPCAIGLAVPMVLVISGGVSASHGVIIKQSSVLERAFKITDVIFDKTGTLTDNELIVSEVEYYGSTSSFTEKQYLIGLIYFLTSNNDHPISLATNVYFKHQLEELYTTVDSTSGFPEIDQVKSITGCGILAEFKNGSTIKLGNPYWCEAESNPGVISMLDKGKTILCLTIGSELLVNIGLGTVLQKDAMNVVGNFQNMGINCHIVSGDNVKAVENVAKSLGISLSNVKSRSTPIEKKEYIKKLKEENTKRVILFCGDGTNDSIAIAQSDIGVQIGTTSEVTKASSDVILLNGIGGLIYLQAISRKSFNRIVFNFVWSGVYNLFAILLSAGAFVRFRIPPAYAGLGEIVSVTPVIVAALSIYWHSK